MGMEGSLLRFQRGSMRLARVTLDVAPAPGLRRSPRSARSSSLLKPTCQHPSGLRMEHGSLGLDESSVVPGCEAAVTIQVRNSRWGTEHFAENFIKGREFNLALIE